MCVTLSTIPLGQPHTSLRNKVVPSQSTVSLIVGVQFAFMLISEEHSNRASTPSEITLIENGPHFHVGCSAAAR